MMIDLVALYINGIMLVIVKYLAFSSIFKPAVKRRWMILAYGGFLIVTTQVFLQFGNPWLTLGANVVTSIALTFLFKGSISAKLVFSMLVYLTAVLSEVVALLLASFWHDNQGVNLIRDDTLLLARSVANSVHLISIFLLIFLFRRFIHKKVKEKYFEIPRKYTVSILTLLLGIIFMKALFLMAVSDDIYDQAIFVVISNMVSTTLLLLIIWFYNTILNHLEEFEKSKLKDQMLERWEVQYQTAVSAQRAMVDIQHNLNFCLLSLASLIEEGKITQAEQLIKNKIGSFNSVIVTGNISIDTMLNYYQQKASETLGISLETELLIPPNLNLNANLVASILGNALENALDACVHLPQEKRYIQVKAEITKQNELFIIIKNPYTVAPVTDKGGNFLTTKENVQNHGIGLLSIQEILEEKDGHIHVEYGENVFRFMLLFYNILP